MARKWQLKVLKSYHIYAHMFQCGGGGFLYKPPLTTKQKQILKTGCCNISPFLKSKTIVNSSYPCLKLEDLLKNTERSLVAMYEVSSIKNVYLSMKYEGIKLQK